MATITGSAIGYAPGTVPAGLPPEVSRFLSEELAKVAGCIRALAQGHLETTYVAPAKPREGDIRLSDGTSWDPIAAGAARFVGYRGGAWVLLG